MKKIILASQSPRRQELLTQLKIPFEVKVSNVDEDQSEVMSAYPYVQTLSSMKAEAVVQQQTEDCIVIGADTVVVFQGQILGKPGSEQEALQMLRMLSGHMHTVYTGVTLIEKKGDTLTKKSAVDTACVYMRAFTDAEARQYIETKEPLDKAGAYGIQGIGAFLVEKIEGDYYTIVGLPIVKVYEMLKEFGYPFNFC